MDSKNVLKDIMREVKNDIFAKVRRTYFMISRASGAVKSWEMRLHIHSNIDEVVVRRTRWVESMNGYVMGLQNGHLGTPSQFTNLGNPTGK